MRAIRFLPLAFLAGADGMALFVPYLLVVMTAVYVIQGRRARQTPLAGELTVMLGRRSRFRMALPSFFTPAPQVQATP